jgi:hypothetical protein
MIPIPLGLAARGKSSGKGRMMPPRRGWGIFGLGFYKDVALTVLGKYGLYFLFVFIEEKVNVINRNQRFQNVVGKLKPFSIHSKLCKFFVKFFLVFAGIDTLPRFQQFKFEWRTRLQY